MRKDRQVYPIAGYCDGVTLYEHMLTAAIEGLCADPDKFFDDKHLAQYAVGVVDNVFDIVNAKSKTVDDSH